MNALMGLPNFNDDPMSDKLNGMDLAQQPAVPYYWNANLKADFLVLVEAVTHRSGNDNPFHDAHDRSRQYLQQFLVDIKTSKQATKEFTEHENWTTYMAASIFNIANLPISHFDDALVTSASTVGTSYATTLGSIASKIREKDQTLLPVDANPTNTNRLNGFAATALNVHRLGRHGMPLPATSTEFHTMAMGMSMGLSEDALKTAGMERNKQVVLRIILFVQSNLNQLQRALRSPSCFKALSGQTNNPSILIDGTYSDVMAAISSWASITELGRIYLSHESLRHLRTPLTMIHDLYSFLFVHMTNNVINFGMCAKTLVQVYAKRKTNKRSTQPRGRGQWQDRNKSDTRKDDARNDQRGDPSKRSKYKETRTCFKCDKVGHIASNCTGTNSSGKDG